MICSNSNKNVSEHEKSRKIQTNTDKEKCRNDKTLDKNEEIFMVSNV